MAKIEINKSQLKKIEKIVADLDKFEKSEIQRQMMITADDAVLMAKQKVPVDTGALKQSIRSRREGMDSSAMFSIKEYGPFIEFGTRKSGAQPFFFNSARKALKNAESRLNDILNKKIR